MLRFPVACTIDQAKQNLSRLHKIHKAKEGVKLAIQADAPGMLCGWSVVGYLGVTYKQRKELEQNGTGLPEDTITISSPPDEISWHPQLQASGEVHGNPTMNYQLAHSSYHVFVVINKGNIPLGGTKTKHREWISVGIVGVESRSSNRRSHRI